MELDRQEEGSTNINLAQFATFLSDTLVNLIFPESKSRSICLAIEEVHVMLPHEEIFVEAGVFDRIWTIHTFVTVDRHSDDCWRTQRGAEGI